MTTESESPANAQPSIPKWINERVLPATEEHVRSLHLLKESGLRNSALLFTDDHAYVAEKGTLTGVKLYEVDYPSGLFVNGKDCPHCGKVIREPVRKDATVQKSGNGRSSHARPTPTRQVPEGKNLPVEEIEGIGSTYVTRLEKGGVMTTDDLLASDVETITRLSKAPAATVEKWFGMAELLRVSGIGKQFAELLVRSGVSSIDELAAQKPKELAAKVNATMESVDVTIQGAGVNEKRAGTWIKAARKTGKRTVTTPA